MKKKVLVVSPKDFLTHKGGDSALTNLLVNDLKFTFDVHTVSLSNISSDSSNDHKVYKSRISYIKLFLNLFRGLHPYFSRFIEPKIVDCIQDLEPDFVICEHLYMTPMAIAAKNRRDFKLISNIHVLESRIQSGHRKLLLPLLRRNELSALRASDSNWSFDEKEVSQLQEYKDIASKTRKVFPSFKNGLKTDLQGDIFFLGNQFWNPNRLAVQNILTMWPRITALFPTARIRIIGDYDTSWYESIPIGVSIEGRVDDLSLLLNHARLLVAPISVGGGVRVKILECISRGIPVLSTDLGIGDLKNDFPAIISSPNLEDLEKELIKILDNDCDLDYVSNSLYESNSLFQSYSSYSKILLELDN